MVQSIGSEIAGKVVMPVLQPVLDFVGRFYISPLLAVAVIIIPISIFMFVKAKPGPVRGFFRFFLVFLMVAALVEGIRDEFSFVHAKLNHVETYSSQQTSFLPSSSAPLTMVKSSTESRRIATIQRSLGEKAGEMPN